MYGAEPIPRKTRENSHLSSLADLKALCKQEVWGQGRAVNYRNVEGVSEIMQGLLQRVRDDWFKVFEEISIKS